MSLFGDVGAQFDTVALNELEILEKEIKQTYLVRYLLQIKTKQVNT